MAEVDAAQWSATSHRWRWLAAGVIVLLTILRLVYLAFWCPLDLAPDESHYWDWSRHLDWSYYSKGPLVAWLIRASLALFGPISIALTGTEVFAIRFPAVICGALLLTATYTLAVQTLKDERLAFLALISLCTLPPVHAGSILMTIDAPFVCCWSWALVTGHSALLQNKRGAWVATGVLIGLGILAKYTMCLWFLSAGLFLITTPGLRGILLKREFWVMTAVTFLMCMPILIWNVQNNFVTFRHVANQAGIGSSGHSGILWFGPFKYVAIQCGILMIYWFIAWVAALVRYWPGRSGNLHTAYLWWFSVPVFILFGVASFRSEGQPNWPVAAYLSGIVLVAAWVAQQITEAEPSYRRLARAGFGIACTVGVLISVVAHQTRSIRPLLTAVTAKPTVEKPFPVRQLDPTCRLRGWHYLASAVDALRREVALEEGREPLLAGPKWDVPGVLGFYCQGQPTVFSFGLALGDRHSQYDLWRPNPVEDSQDFIGKTFVFVGPDSPSLNMAFETVEKSRLIVYSEGGTPVAGWSIRVCRGFRGFPVNISPATGRNY